MSYTSEKSHEVNSEMEVLWYVREKFDSKLRNATYPVSFPITPGAVRESAVLQVGEMLNIPEGYFKHSRDCDMPLDQIAAIFIKHEGKTVARFYVNNVLRREGNFVPNHFREFIPEDDEWMTVAESRKSWGVFEISHDVPSRYGSGWDAQTKKVLLESSDKIVRLIGEDFRIIDPRTELASSPRAGQTPSPG